MRLFSKVIIFSIICYLSISCGGDKSSRKSDGRLIKAEGGKFFGGVFRINESEYIKNLFPHNITDAYSYRVASQIYEGLFTFDPETLEVTKGLIEDYKVDETGTIYTFQLKKGLRTIELITEKDSIGETFYFTEFFRSRIEDRARANIARYLANLADQGNA